MLHDAARCCTIMRDALLCSARLCSTLLLRYTTVSLCSLRLFSCFLTCPSAGDIDQEDVGTEDGRWKQLLSYFEQCDSGAGAEDEFDEEHDGEGEGEGEGEKKPRAGPEAGDGAISFAEYLVCAGQWTDHGEMFDFSEWDYLSTIGVLTEEGAGEFRASKARENRMRGEDAQRLACTPTVASPRLLGCGRPTDS